MKEPITNMSDLLARPDLDRTRADADWWRQAAVYQIYPRSFADADGDGIGDLRGILSRVPYLRRLGIDAVWLSPFYPSALADGGYDVDDYRESPTFKVMELLEADGAEVVLVDPHVASFEDHHGRVYHTTPLTDDLLDAADCAVIVTDHSAFDYERIVARSKALVDTRNATRHVRDGREKIFLL